MPVRNTESRLPAGLTAADLGQAVAAGTFTLVSYLESPLRHHADHKPIRNRYVLFDTNAASEPNNYRWKIKFAFSNSADVELQDLTGIEGGAVFQLDLSDSPFSAAVDGKNLTGITVTVNTAAGQELELDQDVTDLLIDIENLIANFDNERGANAGEPDTTRLLGNDYKQYFLRLSGLAGINTDEISLNLIATLVYQAVESDSSFFSRLARFVFKPDDEKWIDYVNGTNGVYAEDLIGTKVSLMNIKTHVFHFMREDPNGGYIILEDFDADKDVDKYESNLLTRFDALPADTKIDAFNRLRFPKLCIESVWRFLSLLKGHHVDFLSNILDRDNHTNNRECISTIVTEFETVPQDQLDDVSCTAVQAYDIMYSKWMQAILNTSLVQTEKLKVKVLDVRSGRPVANTRVRKLIVYGVKGNDTRKYGTRSQVDLLYDRDRINEPNVLRGAQIALLRLGYAPAPTQRTTAEEQPAGWCDGAWGGQTSQAYNEYWQDRLLDNSMDTTGNAADRPDDADLSAIVSDYNAHAYSDDQGVVEVRIPKKFLDEREVFFDLQFWELPAFLEETDSAGTLSRGSDSESNPTEFSVEWTGGAGANQMWNWSDYIDANDQFDLNVRFGWRVTHGVDAEELRAVNRISVKNGEAVFEGFDESLLSKFYDVDSYPVHFVVFGLVWCPPLVDGLVDTFDGDHRSNRRVFRNRRDAAGAWYENVGMHLVTKHVGGSHYRYGFFDRDNPESAAAGQLGQHNYRGRAHDSSDIYSGSLSIGVTNCFASHGGKFIDDPNPNPNGYGTNNVFIEFENPYTTNANNRKKRFRYMHLSFREALNDQVVPAGVIIGQTGREGNFVAASPSHLHFELINHNQSAANSSVEPSSFLETHDPANEKALPGNKLPLLLPCAGIYGYAPGDANDPVGCDFRDTNILRTCWAVQEYPEYDHQAARVFPNDEFPERVVVNNMRMFACPFVHFDTPAITDVFSIQAHLKFVFENRGQGSIPNAAFEDPGAIDNLIVGAVPANQAVNLQPGDVVNVLATDNPRRQVQIQSGGVSGWVLNTGSLIAGNTIQAPLQSISSAVVTSSTLIAVGMYRALIADLNFNLNNYGTNFAIDMPLANSLKGQMVLYNDV